MVVGGAEQHAAPRVAQVEALLGAGDADVAEPAFLFELVGIAEAAHVREHAVLETDRNTTGNSSPFAECSVISVTELCLGIVLVEVGDERDRLEERLHARQPVGIVDAAARRLGRRRRRRRSRRARRGRRASTCSSNSRADADELLQVLDAALRLDRALGLELGEVAAALEHRFERRRRRRRRPRRSTSSISSSRSRDPAERLAGDARRGRRRAAPSRNVTPAPCAYASTFATDVSPTPRCGVLTMRFHDTSSSGFTSARRYASASLTSRRS